MGILERPLNGLPPPYLVDWATIFINEIAFLQNRSRDFIMAHSWPMHCNIAYCVDKRQQSRSRRPTALR